jgi:hypothetical protein
MRRSLARRLLKASLAGRAMRSLHRHLAAKSISEAGERSAMRSIATIAVACSLLGAAYLHLNRTPPGPVPRQIPGPVRQLRAASADEPVALIDCEKARKLAHSPDHNLPRLGNAALRAMDRVPVRSADSFVTLSGWRMDISSDRGAGAITSFERPQGTCYVGDGVLAAWPAEDLARAYTQLTPDPPPLYDDFIQLD